MKYILKNEQLYSLYSFIFCSLGKVTQMASIQLEIYQQIGQISADRLEESALLLCLRCSAQATPLRVERV